MQRTTTGPPIEEILGSWPSQPQEAAQKTIERHGQPDEATPLKLI